MRLHTNKAFDHRPWVYGKDTEAIVRTFWQMRESLSPTLIAAGAKATEDGSPVVKRLDLLWPTLDQATRSDQYILGEDMLVAPLNPFGIPANKRSVTFPDGLWMDAFTQKTYKGPQTTTIDSVDE